MKLARQQNKTNTESKYPIYFSMTNGIHYEIVLGVKVEHSKYISAIAKDLANPSPHNLSLSEVYDPDSFKFFLTLTESVSLLTEEQSRYVYKSFNNMRKSEYTIVSRVESIHPYGRSHSRYNRAGSKVHGTSIRGI